MTILGIGVDIVHIPRIASVLRKRHAERFVKKVLSQSEYAGWLNLTGSGAPESDRVRYMAVRWVCLSIGRVFVCSRSGTEVVRGGL